MDAILASEPIASTTKLAPARAVSESVQIAVSEIVGPRMRCSRYGVSFSSCQVVQ